MKIVLPGLLKERMASGHYRYRVRVDGKKWLRIPLSVGPDDPQFIEHYRAARAGIRLEATTSPQDAAVPQSVEWLTYEYEAHMRALVKASLMDAKTQKQRAAFYARLRAEYGPKDMAMPQSAIYALRDKMVATPGAADNMVKAVRALYAWAIKVGHVKANPATGIEKINRGTGATPWTVDDMRKFRERHPSGTTAHLALTLFMFTSCRIEDVVKLGRGNETTRDCITVLSWQPSKKGSAPVSVPILPPLAKAIAAQKVVGPAYLLTEYGKPFAIGAAFGNKFRKWCAEAKLTDRSPHGIRKAAGELMALEGASQYHIMAVQSHTQAKTSEVYTKGVDRARLAAEAMQLLAGMDW